MIIISGTSNALLLAIINSAAAASEDTQLEVRLFFTGILCISLFIITKRFVMRQSVFHVEEMIRKVRVRIVKKIRRSELSVMEQEGTNDIYAAISQDANQISQTVSFMGIGFQSLIMVLFSVGYVAFISIPAFVIMLVYFVVGITAYLRLNGAANGFLREAVKKESLFFGVMDSILKGFKELKINKVKNQSIFERFELVTGQSKKYKVQAMYKIISSYMFSQSFFYVLLVIIIFILPLYTEITEDNIVKLSASILFIIGPLEAIVTSIPTFVQANVASENILRLEKRLEANLSEEELAKINDPYYNVPPLPLEHSITLKDLTFAYPKNGFRVGPVNLSIEKGKITFISGGNGSGKSTFLKLLTGLYNAQTGSIMVDDTPLTPQNHDAYQTLYSAIFTDFYLFERLYGLDEVDPERVEQLLRTMRIDQKTSIVDGAITDRNLSTGQRKRLALVVALLEDKPVYIFDEVAADQDPQFKKFFYEELLVELKASGKTLVVVTHDDLYFDNCDYHYRFDNGVLSEYQPG